MNGSGFILAARCELVHPLVLLPMALCPQRSSAQAGEQGQYRETVLNHETEGV